MTAVDGTAQESACATDMLRRDHEHVRELFEQYRRRMDEAPEACRALAEAICMQWELHTQLERELLYPALAEDAALVGDALRAHEDIEECIAIIKRWPPPSVRDSTMLRLMQLAAVHMTSEEEFLFPLARRALGSRNEVLGKEMLCRREALAGSTADVEGRS